MRYAEVSVNSPIGQKSAFSYRIPDDLNLAEGQPVWAPFGNKVLQGIVLKLTPSPLVEETRDIAGIIESIPLVSPVRIALAQWISSNYLAPLFASVALMLPPGFERRVVTLIGNPPNAVSIPDDLTPDQRRMLEFIRTKDNVPLKELAKKFGVQSAKKDLSALLGRGLATKTYKLENEKVKPRMASYIRLKTGPEEAEKAMSSFSKSSPRQAEIIRYLIANPGPAAEQQLKQDLACSHQTIKSLLDKNLIELFKERSARDPLILGRAKLSSALKLTADQEKAYQQICAGLRNAGGPPAKPEVFLLHGVTGSGKTEIYLQCLEEAKRLGKKAIVMVPEISMTPQIIERFAARFPGKVAVLHSGLSLGEQFDEWWRIYHGEFDVVIGPRSAIFAPQPDLGLIIIDEEHEWTYKQTDKPPHYHARQAALKLAQLSGATVILGSATPEVESYFKALLGEFQLLNLPQRINQAEGTPLPAVEVIDLRRELKAGNFSVFSRSLSRAMEKALENKQQVLLFLNRRGSASIIECRDCGFVICCKRCEIPMSYHFAGQILLCHQCNYRIPVPQYCPRCRSRRIKYLGIGTEQLERETARVFPQARILRWDSDVTRGGGHTHQDIFQQFQSGQADILIGTQMIAKGLDFPGIAVVGVVNADIALNLPDFRSGERTFQLLSQVGGRAGRGTEQGQVLIQTYSPENYAIQAAAGNDYRAFYEKEIAYRRELHNPPFSRLARLVYTHKNDARCQEESQRIRGLLVQKKEAFGLGDIGLVGPAPAFFHRLRGRYRWQMVLRASDPAAFLGDIPFPRGWVIDVDPVGMA